MWGRRLQPPPAQRKRHVVGIPDRPLPPLWPQAAARVVPGHSPGGGHTPLAGGKEAPAPAHQGGSRVPVMAHGRASSEVT